MYVHTNLYRFLLISMSSKQLYVFCLQVSSREPSLMQFYISKQWVNKFNNFSEPGPIDNYDFLCPHGGVQPQKVILKSCLKFK